MDHICMYRVDPAYVDYLSPYAPRLFHNSKPSQQHPRVYIGVVLRIHGMDYFAPLSSYKDKHRHMEETLDLIKIRDYAVINLNCMFPVPQHCCHYVEIAREQNPHYRFVLSGEYRRIRMIEDKIRKNARMLYRLQTSGEHSGVSERCNDYRLLERLCREYRA